VHRALCLFNTSQLSLVLTAPIQAGMARLSWPEWLVTKQADSTACHWSTNRAPCWLTLLMLPTMLPIKRNRHSTELQINHRPAQSERWQHSDASGCRRLAGYPSATRPGAARRPMACQMALVWAAAPGDSYERTARSGDGSFLKHSVVVVVVIVVVVEVQHV